LPTPTTQACRPIIFRLPFPSHIQQRLVLAKNPTGSITNSDLELAAIVLGATVLRHTHPTTHATLLCASDNQAAVTWQNQGSPSSSAARAFLLRWLATLTQRDQFDINTVFALGTTNTLANVFSRHFHLSDQVFSELITRHFPIPGGWQFVRLTKEIASNMISALCGKMLPWEFPDHNRPLPALLGSSGRNSVKPLQWIPPEMTSQILYRFFKSLPTAGRRPSSHWPDDGPHGTRRPKTSTLRQTRPPLEPPPVSIQQSRPATRPRQAHPASTHSSYMRSSTPIESPARPRHRRHAHTGFLLSSSTWRIRPHRQPGFSALSTYGCSSYGGLSLLTPPHLPFAQTTRRHLRLSGIYNAKEWS
jgi:hypothetical protein